MMFVLILECYKNTLSTVVILPLTDIYSGIPKILSLKLALFDQSRPNEYQKVSFGVYTNFIV